MGLDRIERHVTCAVPAQKSQRGRSRLIRSDSGLYKISAASSDAFAPRYNIAPRIMSNAMLK